jgi:hypothetical protein
MYDSSLQLLNWDAPNGTLLKKFIKQLPQDRPIVLNVFGSTPLQMRLDPSFLSGHVAMFTSEDLSGYLEKMKLGKEHARLTSNSFPPRSSSPLRPGETGRQKRYSET